MAHVQNQHVEAHFHAVKHTVLEKKRECVNRKYFQEASKLRALLADNSRFDLRRPKCSKAKPALPRKDKHHTSMLIPSAEDPSVQEEWRKRPLKCKETCICTPKRKGCDQPLPKNKSQSVTNESNITKDVQSSRVRTWSDASSRY